MTPVDLIRLNVRLEYKCVTSDNRLIPFPNSSEQSRCLIHKHHAGYELFLRHDLPIAISDSILALPKEVVFNDPDRIKIILAPCTEMWIGKSYYVPYEPNRAQFSDAVYVDSRWLIRVDDQAVAWAWTVRENDQAAEVAVETEPRYRRRGYAAQVLSQGRASVIARPRRFL